MCLAIPGRVTETYQENGMLMGRIDFNGISKAACLEHVPSVRIGEYVLVHVGFALAIVDEVEAKRVFAYLAEMKELDELQAS
jgi:hydrogenase expression/formation protein HypC